MVKRCVKLRTTCCNAQGQGTLSANASSAYLDSIIGVLICSSDPSGNLEKLPQPTNSMLAPPKIDLKRKRASHQSYQSQRSAQPSTHPLPSEWQCSACTLLNSSRYWKCVLCGCDRVSLSRATSNTQMPSASEGMSRDGGREVIVVDDDSGSDRDDCTYIESQEEDSGILKASVDYRRQCTTSKGGHVSSLESLLSYAKYLRGETVNASSIRPAIDLEQTTDELLGTVQAADMPPFGPRTVHILGRRLGDARKGKSLLVGETTSGFHDAYLTVLYRSEWRRSLCGGLGAADLGGARARNSGGSPRL